MSYFQFRSVGKWVGSAVMASLQDFEIQAVPLLKRSKMWNKNELIETIRHIKVIKCSVFIGDPLSPMTTH
jgi:hypothetical protein